MQKPVLPRMLASQTVSIRTSSERAVLIQLDSQRRLQLLRFIVPGLLVLLILSLPGVFVSPTLSEVLQICIGFVTYSIALWATLRRRVSTASIALLFGVTTRAIAVVLFSGPLRGEINPSTVVDLFLLILPIIIAGIFTEPRIVAIISCICVIFTTGIFLTISRSHSLNTLLTVPENAVLIILPIVIPLLIGFLMFVGTLGFRRVQQELEDARIALAREKAVERLREQFISNVNHELRTPLMALQSYLVMAQELRQRGDVVNEHRMIDEATKVSDDLGRVVKSVLNLRRLRTNSNTLEFTSLDVFEQISRAIEVVQRWNSDQEQRDLHLTISAGMHVRGEESRLQEILTNLISNAIKYSPAGTAIEIGAHVITEAAKPIVEFYVRDYGYGIPPDEGILLFEPFVRLERDITSSTLGTGLGLAICRTHVEAMEGKIWLNSTGIPGAGTTFYVHLSSV